MAFHLYISKCFIKEIIINKGTQTSSFGLWHVSQFTCKVDLPAQLYSGHLKLQFLNDWGRVEGFLAEIQ